jgi:hypothetical protein
VLGASFSLFDKKSKIIVGAEDLARASGDFDDCAVSRNGKQ